MFGDFFDWLLVRVSLFVVIVRFLNFVCFRNVINFSFVGCLLVVFGFCLFSLVDGFCWFCLDCCFVWYWFLWILLYVGCLAGSLPASWVA